MHQYVFILHIHINRKLTRIYKQKQSKEPRAHELFGSGRCIFINIILLCIAVYCSVLQCDSV